MPFNAYAPMDLTKKLSSGKIELWWKRFLLQNTLENDFDFASQKLKPGHLNERKGVQCYTLVTVVVSSNSKAQWKLYLRYRCYVSKQRTMVRMTFKGFTRQPHAAADYRHTLYQLALAFQKQSWKKVKVV